MTIQQALAAILRALGGVYSLVQAIQSVQQWGQLFTDLQTLLTGINNIGAVVTDPTVGLAAIQSQLVTEWGILAGYQTALLAAIAAVQQAANPVILPTTPPPGYAGGTDAAGVWAFVAAGASRDMGNFMAAAGSLANYETAVQISKRTYEAPGWYVGGNWNEDSQTDPSSVDLVDLDPSTILSTDLTLGDWVSRVAPGYTGSFDEMGRPIIEQSGTAWRWTYEMGTQEFAEYKAAVFGGSGATLPIPPIWPGTAGVTLGASISLSSQMTVTAPMDGVLIEISSVLASKTFFPYGGVNGYRGIGALSFFSDHGEQEVFQPLMFTSQVYSPREMVTASGVRLRVDPSVTGTLTPWTITPP